MDEYTPTESDWAEYSVYCSELDERDYHLSTCTAGCFCEICEGEHNDRV